MTTWITNIAEVESDAAELISDDSSSEVGHIDMKIDQGTKFGTLKKPIISLNDEIIFLII